MEPSQPEQNETVTGQGVLEKYTAAGKVTKAVLAALITQCVEGASITEICESGDTMIVEECGKVFKNKKFDRGIAFPTCLSVNEICGHFSPLKDESRNLQTGDVVKM